MEKMICQICGGGLREVSSGVLKCDCCDSEFQAFTFDKQIETLNKLLTEQKQEELRNCRQNLWAELNSEYLSSEEIIKWAREVKKLMPKDFLAEFSSVLCGKDPRQTAKFLNDIDTDKYLEYVEIVIKVMLKSLKKAHLLAMNNLIERTYKAKDIEKYAKYNILLQKEAAKVEEGVYRLNLPRDAFIAYSSKDMEKVNKLTEVLEENGLKCFVAMRNMQHGSGAVENYDKALQTAIKNCKVFVFVSSSNSRSTDCDALSELDYIRENEFNKPRVEYLIEDYKGKNRVGESIVKEFFSGYEYCYTSEDVAERVAKLRNANRVKNETAPKIEENIKYCKNCGAKVPEKAKFCTECGSTEFVRDYEAYKKAEAEAVENDNQRLADENNRLKVELEAARERESKRLAEQEAAREEKGIVAKVSDNKPDEKEEIEAYNPDEFEIKGTTLVKYKGKNANVVIPKGVTSIGNVAFASCKFLTSITIPDSVTSIGNSAFSDCHSLTSITIPDSVTSIGNSAFCYCESFTSITIPDSVTSIGDRAFSDCESLTSITILDSVTSIGDEAFARCKFLTSITIPNSVTSIGDRAFSGCESLTSITIPDSVTSIGNSAFSDCSSLTSITIPNSVTSIGDETFVACSSLTNITIPDSVTSIGNSAFSWCESLTDITIPDSVTSIGVCAFSWCESLTDITIPDSVTSIGKGAFAFCQSPKKIVVDKNNKNYYIEGNCLIEMNSKTLIWGTNESMIPKDVLRIEEYAFSWCESLTSITIPDSVTSIGEYAFSDCHSLTSITIPDSVTSIGNSAFSKCHSLTSITIPNSVTSIGNSAFSDCESLTNITIPDSVTSIGNRAFAYCSSLTSITIPNRIANIGEEAFCGCDKLTVFCQIKSKSNTWEEGWNCNRPVIWYNDDLKKGITLVKYEGKVVNVVIPNGVTSIGDKLFSSCHSLTSITIPSGVTSIGNCAFYECTSLTSITIPSSVTSIGDKAFWGCGNLTIYCEAKKKPDGWHKDWNKCKEGIFGGRVPVKWGC